MPRSGTTASANNKRADAGDLAKRIEDRRRQMRDDAENLRKQGGNKAKPPPPNHPTPPKQ